MAAAMGAALSLSAAASAGTLYGVTYTGAANAELFTLNEATGAATLVGGTNQNIGDLTNVGNQLVGVDLGRNALFNIDAATGASSNMLIVTGSIGTITSIAYDPTSGTMFGNTTAGFGSGDDALYSIDLTTGAATRIGAIGVTNMYALGVDAAGNMFGSGDSGTIYSIDKATGAASSIGSSGTALIFDIATNVDTGTMFAASSSAASLFTINSATGAGTLVGPYGAPLNIAGLAYLSAVPEPGTWAMMLTGFGLLGAAMRRQTGRVRLA